MICPASWAAPPFSLLRRLAPHSPAFTPNNLHKRKPAHPHICPVKSYLSSRPSSNVTTSIGPSMGILLEVHVPSSRLTIRSGAYLNCKSWRVRILSPLPPIGHKLNVKSRLLSPKVRTNQKGDAYFLNHYTLSLCVELPQKGSSQPFLPEGTFRSADVGFEQLWQGISGHTAHLFQAEADLIKGHFGNSSVLRATKNCGGRSRGGKTDIRILV